MALAEPDLIQVVESHRPPRLVRWLGPAWPLKALLLGFPLWWALGLGGFAVLAAALAMAVQMVRRGRFRLPAGFGVWVLFLLWMAAGVFVLWAHAPGTLDDGGPARLIGFGYRVLWYLAVTVAMVYPLSLSSRVLPPMAVVRWLGWLFLVVVTGGLLGVLAPRFEFTSPMELIVPGASGEGWLNSLMHPSLTTSSDFLGYEQPRPKAPFAYANAWGNNLGLLLPFFVLGWGTMKQRWQRRSVLVMLGLVTLVAVLVAPPTTALGLLGVTSLTGLALSRPAWRPAAAVVVLALALVPITASLNRGLWIGLVVLAVYAALNLARQKRYTALVALLAAAGIAAVVVAATPIADTVRLRLDTPHSNDRRATVAQTVTATTLEGSPLLGYGTTRQVAGSFASIAGGETPDCHQCAAPPMGTQGFLWRLIFTTGFVGTALFYTFVAIQLLRHIRRRDPVSVVGCMALVVSLLFFLVYDSLESPLFILMLAVGLMNRQRLEEQDRDDSPLDDRPQVRTAT